MLRALVLFAAALFALGCAPSIGDKCQSSTDCSQLGERLCDTTQPNGYCTIFNCEPDTCPDSVCVGFYTNDQCVDYGQWPRFERTFCMKKCDTDGDCRDGYKCLDPNDPNNIARGAHIVDTDVSAGQKVCMAASADPNTQKPPGKTQNGVCEPGDAGPPWTPYDAGSELTVAASSSVSSSSAGGAGGSGGKGGAGGAGGAGGKGGAGGMGGVAGGGGSGG